MSIISGIGIGEAQVYDTSKLEYNYFKSLENAQKANQRKLEALADITKDIPETLGTRKVDEQDFKNLYTGIKDLNRQAQSLVGTKRYTEAVAEVENKIKAYKEAVYRSKKEAENEKTGARFIAENVGFVEDDDIKKFNNRKNTSILNLVDDYDVASSILIPKTDSRKAVESALMGKEGEQYAILDKSATEKLGGGAIQYNKVLKPEAAITIIKEKLLDPQYRRLAYYEYKQKNPEATEINDDIVAKNEYNIFAPEGAIKFKANVVTPSTKTGDNASNPANYEVIRNKTFSTEEIRDKDKVIKPSKPIITFDTFVTTPVGQPFATPQIGNAFNITEGKSEAIGSKKGLRITGMGVKNGNLRVTVVDDDEFEYYLKPEDIPLTIRNGNQYKAAKKALGGSSAPAPESGTQANGPSIVYSNITKGKDSKGNVITIGYRDGKWFNTKTNKEVK